MSHRVSAWEIAKAWDEMEESVRRYQRKHHDLRSREAADVESAFAIFADLVARAHVQTHRETQS